MNDSLYATPRTDSHSIIDDSIVHTRPRIPSSLRFSHSSDSQPTSQDQDSSSPTAKTVSSAGTFVFREGDSSVAYRDGEENQLQAAVKALRGPAGGLGGAPVAEGVEADVIATPVKTKKTADRLGGLLGLFEPPKSTIGQSIVAIYQNHRLTLITQLPRHFQLRVPTRSTLLLPLPPREPPGKPFLTSPPPTPLLPSLSPLSSSPTTIHRLATPPSKLPRQNLKIDISVPPIYLPSLLRPRNPPHPPIALPSLLLPHRNPNSIDSTRQNRSAHRSIASSNSSTILSPEIISLHWWRRSTGSDLESERSKRRRSNWIKLGKRVSSNCLRSRWQLAMTTWTTTQVARVSGFDSVLPRTASFCSRLVNEGPPVELV